MSIIAAELKTYAAASMPEDDVSTTGGAIDTAVKTELVDIAATDTVTYVSDGADTRNITVTGRSAAGAIVSETKALNGATPVVGAVSFERILKIVAASSSGTRTVTITRTTGGATIATLEPNITAARRFFYNAASESGATTRYEKYFWKQENATLTLNGANITLTADPAAKIRVGCAPSINDTATVANRKSAPGSVTFVDDSVLQNVPGGVLAAADKIGVWVEMALASNDAPVKNSFTVQLAGTSI